MKKLFTLLTVALLGLGAANAQQTQQKSATTTSAVHTTKSGKPDMRWKQNQQKENKASSPAAVQAGPKKKDGSLDMRYKANKGPGKTTIKKS